MRIRMAISFIFLGSDQSKLDQIGFFTNQKMATIKSCGIYHEDKNGHLLSFFWIKSVQTWSNLIELDFSQIRKKGYKKLATLLLIRLDQTWFQDITYILDFFEQDQIKLDQ